MMARRNSLATRVARPWARGSAAAPRRGDGGFTLLELLITLVVLPIVIGAITAGLVTIFSIQNSVSNRLSDTDDVQIISANYVQDVESATFITTDANLTATQCGTGTQLLGLEWNPNSAGVYQTVVTYAEVADGSKNLLFRNLCTSGASSTPTARTLMSTDVPAGLTNGVTLYPTGATGPGPSAAIGWFSVTTVTSVVLSFTEPASSYLFHLAATPESAGPLGDAGAPIISTANTQCGFAPTQGGTVSNGYYAQTLCLVDFTGFVQSASGCQTIVASVPGTGDTLSFCLSVTGSPGVIASALPTYPEAFLGNTIGGSPFYTGLGCPDSTSPTTGTGAPTPSCSEPALYQQNEGSTDTITVTNINVTTATGQPATGWEFVSADAETTDVGESITWTSDKPLSVLQNSPSSPFGDTCDNLPAGTNGPQVVSADEIQCVSGALETSATKTGTPIVQAVQPTTMTIYMVGTGLEGIALGLHVS